MPLAADILDTPIRVPLARAGIIPVGTGAYGLARAQPRTSMRIWEHAPITYHDAGWGFFKSIGHFFSKAASSVAHAASSVAKTVAHATSSVGKSIAGAARGAVKFAGRAASTVARGVAKGVSGAVKGISSAVDAIEHNKIIAAIGNNPIFKKIWLAATATERLYLLPFTAAGAAIRGENVLNFAKREFDRSVKGYKAQAEVIAQWGGNIPVIGQGVAAAAGAGLALADGKPLSQAVVEGIASSLPGGPLAQAGFRAGITAVTAIARGERWDQALLESARAAIPGDAAKKAFDVGLAVAEGKRIQDIAMQNLGNLASALGPAVGGIASQIIQSPALAGLRDAAQVAQKLGVPLDQARAALDAVQKSTGAAKLASMAQSAASSGAADAANRALAAVQKAVPAIRGPLQAVQALGISHGDAAAAVRALTGGGDVDAILRKYGAAAARAIPLLQQAQSIGQAYGVPAADAIRAIGANQPLDAFAAHVAGSYGGFGAQALQAARATLPQIRAAAKLVDTFGDQAMKAIELGQAVAGNPVGLAIAQLTPAAQTAAQTILADPRLRGLPAQEVATRLRIPAEQVQAAIGAVVAGINHVSEGHKDAPPPAVIWGLASQIGPMTTLDSAMGLFATKVAPITLQAGPKYAHPARAHAARAHARVPMPAHAAIVAATHKVLPRGHRRLTTAPPPIPVPPPAAPKLIRSPGDASAAIQAAHDALVVQRGDARGFEEAGRAAASHGGGVYGGGRSLSTGQGSWTDAGDVRAFCDRGYGRLLGREAGAMATNLTQWDAQIDLLRANPTSFPYYLARLNPAGRFAMLARMQQRGIPVPAAPNANQAQIAKFMSVLPAHVQTIMKKHLQGVGNAKHHAERLASAVHHASPRLPGAHFLSDQPAISEPRARLLPTHAMHPVSQAMLHTTHVRAPGRVMAMPAALRVRGPFFSRAFASGFDAGAAPGGIDAREVADAQSKLKDLGYPLVVDGAWGPKTSGAVKDFQSKHGLTADGIYGDQTKMTLAAVWNARAAAAGVPIGPPAPPGMNIQNDSPTTSDVQRKLNDLGYGPLERDGLMGPATKKAVKNFQAQHPPLKVDGVPGPNTRTALEKAWLARTVTKPPTSPGAPPSAPTPTKAPDQPPALITPGVPQLPSGPRQVQPPPGAPTFTPPTPVAPPASPPVVTVTPGGTVITPQPTGPLQTTPTIFPVPGGGGSPRPNLPQPDPSLSGPSQRPPSDGGSNTGLIVAAAALVALLALGGKGRRAA